MIIIPARVESSRFPNKVLADINGLPMVIKTAKVAQKVDSVVIATDSQDVIDIAQKYDINAILTNSSCNSGTDRIYEAATKLGCSNEEIIINVQADEPFIEESVIKELFNLTKKYANSSETIISTLYKVVSKEEAKDPNLVKVVTTNSEQALYFSRSLVPYNRDNIDINYKAHLGLYGFTYQKLKIFCELSNSFLEDTEKLEQLRVLENGYKIAIKEVKSNSFGIDTKEDLEKALRVFV